MRHNTMSTPRRWTSEVGRHLYEELTDEERRKMDGLRTCMALHGLACVHCMMHVTHDCHHGCSLAMHAMRH